MAAKRLAEIDTLYEEIRSTLEQMRASMKESSDFKPKDLLNKLSELQSAHLKVLAAEDSYHDKIGKNPDEDAIDFDAIRAEIGRQLDRVRESLTSSTSGRCRTRCRQAVIGAPG